MNGSYRHETPAYFYKEKDGNLVAIVNATDNSFITVLNATESQLKSIQENNNFGLDTCVHLCRLHEGSEGQKIIINYK